MVGMNSERFIDYPGSDIRGDDDDRDDEHAGENEASIREVDDQTEAPEEFEVDDEDEVDDLQDHDGDDETGEV